MNRTLSRQDADDMKELKDARAIVSNGGQDRLSPGVVQYKLSEPPHDAAFLWPNLAALQWLWQYHDGNGSE